MISVSPKELLTIKSILTKHVPNRIVWVFGSRVNGKAKKYSDLDIVITGDTALTIEESANLRDDFENSDLPFRVDIIDWNETNESFQKIILDKYEII